MVPEYYTDEKEVGTGSFLGLAAQKICCRRDFGRRGWTPSPVAIRAVVSGASLAALLVASVACGTEGGDINDDPNAGTVQDQFDRLMRSIRSW